MKNRTMDIKQLAEALATSQADLRRTFGEKSANDYYISGIEIDYQDPTELSYLQRALNSLSDHARFVSALVEDLGMGMQTAGDCITEIGETREVVHLHATGEVAKSVERQIEAAREGITRAVTMIGHLRTEILAAQEGDES